MTKEMLKGIFAIYKRIEQPKKAPKQNQLKEEDYEKINKVKEMFTSLNKEDRFIALKWLIQILGNRNEALVNLLLLSILSADRYLADHITKGTYWAMEIKHSGMKQKQANVMNFATYIHEVNMHSNNLIEYKHIHAYCYLNNVMIASLCGDYTIEQIDNGEPYIDFAYILHNEVMKEFKECRWVVSNNSIAQNEIHLQNLCK